jgi:plastocyanin
MSDDELTRVISAGIYNPSAPPPANANLIPKAEQYGGQLATNDVDYLVAFVHSTDPNYAKKQGFTGAAAVNGLTLIPDYLQTNDPNIYKQAQQLAQFGQFGQPVDMTKEKAITLTIVDPGTNGVSCASQQGCFTPINVKVKVGTVITWVNKSKLAHTVTAMVGQDTTKPAPQIFDSARGNLANLLASGASFTYTVTAQAYNFDSTNHTVDYFCRVHPDMVAQLIIVQ